MSRVTIHLALRVYPCLSDSLTKPGAALMLCSLIIDSTSDPVTIAQQNKRPAGWVGRYCLYASNKMRIPLLGIHLPIIENLVFVEEEFLLCIFETTVIDTVLPFWAPKYSIRILK